MKDLFDINQLSKIIEKWSKYTGLNAVILDKNGIRVSDFFGEPNFETCDFSTPIVLPDNQVAGRVLVGKKTNDGYGAREKTDRELDAAYELLKETVSFFVNKSYEAIDAAKAEKMSVLFKVSYNIRTPMNAIMGFTELLEKHLDDKELCREYIEKLKLANENMTSFIEKIPELSDFGKQNEVEDDNQDKIADLDIGHFQPDKMVDFHGKRILLAEDNELNAEIAITILEEAGFLVDHAKDGAICVSMLENATPDYYDLILMDIQMPNMGGYKATKKIRKLMDKKKADIIIIAMTANAFDEDKIKSFNAGMNWHIAKPITADNLLGALNMILSREKQ